jgi:hypothetical protein
MKRGWQNLQMIVMGLPSVATNKSQVFEKMIAKVGRRLLIFIRLQPRPYAVLRHRARAQIFTGVLASVRQPLGWGILLSNEHSAFKRCLRKG